MKEKLSRLARSGSLSDLRAALRIQRALDLGLGLELFAQFLQETKVFTMKMPGRNLARQWFVTGFLVPGEREIIIEGQRSRYDGLVYRPLKVRPVPTNAESVLMAPVMGAGVQQVEVGVVTLAVLIGLEPGMLTRDPGAELLEVSPPPLLFRGTPADMSWAADWDGHAQTGLPVTTQEGIAQTYAGPGGVVLRIEFQPGARFLEAPDDSWALSFPSMMERMQELVNIARERGLAGVLVPERLEGTLGHHLVDEQWVSMAIPLYQLPL